MIVSESNKSLAFARLLHFKYAHQRLLPKVNRVQRTVPVPTMQALLPANCSICRGSSSLGVRKKRKNTNKVRAYLFVVRSTQNKWVLTHRCFALDTACPICLLCPLRTISANAVRLQFSLLAVYRDL